MFTAQMIISVSPHMTLKQIGSTGRRFCKSDFRKRSHGNTMASSVCRMTLCIHWLVHGHTDANKYKNCIEPTREENTRRCRRLRISAIRFMNVILRNVEAQGVCGRFSENTFSHIRQPSSENKMSISPSRINKACSCVVQIAVACCDNNTISK